MSNYFRIANLDDKVIYDLGKESQAKYYLPFFAKLYDGHSVVIFGDESHESISDEFEIIKYGGEYREGSYEELYIDTTELDDIVMSTREFSQIIEKIGGIIINNINDYLRYHYRLPIKLTIE